MPREGLGLLVVVIAKAVGVSLGVFLVHGSHFELGAEDCDLCLADARKALRSAPLAEGRFNQIHLLDLQPAAGWHRKIEGAPSRPSPEKGPAEDHFVLRV
jgi:hypothetical protein